MGHVNTAEVLKDAVIRGAISHAEAIGKAFRTARAALHIGLHTGCRVMTLQDMRLAK